MQFIKLIPKSCALRRTAYPDHRKTAQCVPCDHHVTIPFFEQCSGAVEQWCSVTVVQWCSGAVVQWCSGAVVQWCSGAVVQWCSGAVARDSGSNPVLPCKTLDIFITLYCSGSLSCINDYLTMRVCVY